MRAFMRAIGGLFKSSSRETTKAQPARRRGGPAMCTLVPVEDIHLAMPDARASATRGFADSRRLSSVYERPQFLFFCGSDNSDISTARRPGYTNTLNATATTTEFKPRTSFRNSPTAKLKIPAPMISHRMPVFFAAQPAMASSFE